MGFGKRGDISMFLVFLVLAIAGFLIVLLVLPRLDISGYGKDEACKLSVLTRATTGQVSEPGASYVPLKCITGKICITDKFFGECAEFKGEKEVDTIRISGSQTEKAEKIAEISTQAMYECWSQMGEGKLDLFPEGLLGYYNVVSKDPLACVICSRISVDQGMKDRESILSEVNLAEYARKNKIPGQGITYLNAFTDRGVNSYPRIEESGLDKGEEEISSEVVGLEGKDSFKKDQLAVVFSQIKADDYPQAFSKLGSAGVAVAGTAFFAPGGKTAVGTFVKVVGPVKSLGLALIAAAGVSLYTAYNVHKDRVAAAGYCGELASGQNSESLEKGCSGVQLIPYDFQSINSNCDYIDGIP